MGISDVIPVPVALDEEIEKWTIFGQPVAEDQTHIEGGDGIGFSGAGAGFDQPATV